MLVLSQGYSFVLDITRAANKFSAKTLSIFTGNESMPSGQIYFVNFIYRYTERMLSADICLVRHCPRCKLVGYSHHTDEGRGQNDGDRIRLSGIQFPEI